VTTAAPVDEALDSPDPDVLRDPRLPGLYRRVCAAAGLTDSYAVYLPRWRFRVAAGGYEPTAWADLDVPEFRRQARTAGPQKARLVVPVELRRAPP
jgi:hypothetical protein